MNHGIFRVPVSSRALSPHEPKVGFVNQGCGLQGLARLPSSHRD